jgi:hypothetical protein
LIHGTSSENLRLKKKADSFGGANMGERTRKLLTLRARTDHDLLVLVARELDRGFALLDVATTRNSPLFAQAEKAFAAATAILPRIAGLSADDRQRIEAKVEQLRSRIEEVPAYANVRSHPASIAS